VDAQGVTIAANGVLCLLVLVLVVVMRFSKA